MELAIKESLKNGQEAAPPAAKPTPQPTSAVDDLLNLDVGVAQPPTQQQNSFDPWNTGNCQLLLVFETQ